MTVEVRVNAQVNADGKQAAAELQRLTGNIADAKVRTLEASAAAAKLKAELKNLDQSAAGAAARHAELRSSLVSATAAELESGRVAVSASRAYDEYARSIGKVVNSAGQMRAASANLGQQIGDITQGLAAGVNPATIFAQQAGQVSFALSGMGGALGKVGAFLGGPWGIALTAATVLLSPFVSKLFESEGASSRASEGLERFRKAQSEIGTFIDATTGKLKVQNEVLIRNAILTRQEEIRGLTKSVVGARDSAFGAARIARVADASEEDRLAAERGGGGGARFGIDPAIQAAIDKSGKSVVQLDRNLAELVKRQPELAGLAAKVNEFAASATFAKSETDRLKLEIDQLTGKVVIASEAQKATGAATRAAAKDLRDAERAANSYADVLERLARLPGQNATLIGNRNAGGEVPFNLAGKIEADSAQSRQESGLGSIVAGIDSAKDTARGLGKTAAQGFRDGAIADAAAIGNAIGGGLGRAINGIGALGFGTKNAKGITTDFTGVGTKLTSLLTPLADTFRGGGKFIASAIGQAAGGAATGSVVSGIGDALGIKNSKVGAQIGGAIGSFIPIPGGEIIGSILGGLLGGLIGVKSGSTTVSSSGGKISQSGTGNASVQKATGALGNTITDALQAVADQLGGRIGDFAVSIGKRGDSFRVDSSGKGKIRGRTVKDTKDESEALSFAIADAIKDGAIITSSPRIQAVLRQYSDNINKAVAEALKVKGLEDLIADRQNPFIATFRALERQLKQRVDVARQYGFNLVEIERINGEDRAAALKETLGNATDGIRTLLKDLQFGSRATGSPNQRLAGLTAERNRLTGLARGGDTGQLDAIASIIQQIDDLQKETFGKTQGFADGRADSVALLNDLVKTTEDRIKAAADQARAGTETTNAKLTEANASLDDITGLLRQVVLGLGGAKTTGAIGGGGGRETGFNQYLRQQ